MDIDDKPKKSQKELLAEIAKSNLLILKELKGANSEATNEESQSVEDNQRNEHDQSTQSTGNTENDHDVELSQIKPRETTRLIQ